MFWKILQDLGETEACYDMVKEPFALERLTVEVKCHSVDDKRIHGILKLLKFCGVPSSQIKIRPPALSSSESKLARNFLALIFQYSASMYRITAGKK